MDIVKFDKKSVLVYVNSVILNWRNRKQENIDAHMEKRISEDEFMEKDLIASCYVDAFQSMRISLFGKTLPMGATDINYSEDISEYIKEME